MVFTLEEYERMIEAGVFQEDERIELIRGEIIEKVAIGLPHEVCVARLTTLFVRKTADRVLVWPQTNSIRLPSHSRPEPDLTLLRWRDDYNTNKPPAGEDVLLVVEVADSSLNYDRTVKGPVYAEAGIPEYWLVNLQDDLIEIYADPTAGTYKGTKKARRGETLSLPGGFEGTMQVSDILGTT